MRKLTLTTLTALLALGSTPAFANQNSNHDNSTECGKLAEDLGNGDVKGAADHVSGCAKDLGW